MTKTITFTKPAERANLNADTPLQVLLNYDRDGFQPPEREVPELNDCQKADLLSHKCHGPHEICPCCGLEFCAEEFADPAGNSALPDYCTDCWLKYHGIVEYFEYYESHPKATPLAYVSILR